MWSSRGRLRTVANGCERLRNVWRTQLNPHTPRVKREPLLRGKNMVPPWGYKKRGFRISCGDCCSNQIADSDWPFEQDHLRIKAPSWVWLVRARTEPRSTTAVGV